MEAVGVDCFRLRLEPVESHRSVWLSSFDMFNYKTTEREKNVDVRRTQNLHRTGDEIWLPRRGIFASEILKL